MISNKIKEFIYENNELKINGNNYIFKENKKLDKEVINKLIERRNYGLALLYLMIIANCKVLMVIV